MVLKKRRNLVRGTINLSLVNNSSNLHLSCSLIRNADVNEIPWVRNASTKRMMLRWKRRRSMFSPFSRGCTWPTRISPNETSISGNLSIQEAWKMLQKLQPFASINSIKIERNSFCKYISRKSKDHPAIESRTLKIFNVLHIFNGSRSVNRTKFNYNLLTILLIILLLILRDILLLIATLYLLREWLNLLTN